MKDPPPKQQTRQKHKISHQQTGLLPHTDLPIRGRKQQQKLTSPTRVQPQVRAYTNHWTTLPTKDREQKKEGIQPQNLKKGDLKHNKFVKK